LPAHLRNLSPIIKKARKKPYKYYNLTAKDAANPDYGGSQEMALKVGQPYDLRM